MNHEAPEDLGVLVTREYWDERYASADRIWSGQPNQRLVEQAAGLPPGLALEVGCGEGADAVWLASRGWQVTAVDVSPVALQRAAEHAAQAGPQIAERITWQQADVLAWTPAPARFDLVSAHFVHVPGPPLELLHRRLAAAVRPGGTLLVVGHHPSDLHAGVGRPDLADFMFTAEQVAARLDPAEWHVVVAEAAPREATDLDGQPITIHDAVLRAERRR